LLNKWRVNEENKKREKKKKKKKNYRQENVFVQYEQELGWSRGSIGRD
jgi:hypothetical protein